MFSRVGSTLRKNLVSVASKQPLNVAQRSMAYKFDSSLCLTDDQKMLQETAARFAENEILPHAMKWDEEKHFPVDVLRKAAEMGFASIYTREDVGGAELSRLDAAIIFEALAYGCPSTG
jgi:alkylation response protein AidB-like acyl-CoA dehydrogenase